MLYRYLINIYGINEYIHVCIIKTVITEYTAYTQLISLNIVLLALPMLIKEILFHQIFTFYCIIPISLHAAISSRYLHSYHHCYVFGHTAFSLKPTLVILQAPSPTPTTFSTLRCPIALVLLYQYINSIIQIFIYCIYIYFYLLDHKLLESRNLFCSLIYPKHQKTTCNRPGVQ